MSKKQNTKAVAANEKKAGVVAEKQAAKQKELDAAEAADWADGARGKSKAKENEERKRLEALEAKRLREELLAQEAELPTKPRGDAKKAARKEASIHGFGTETHEFAASNLDDALDLMTALKTTGTSNLDKVERHPERRVKSAWAQYEEEELPKLKKENPGLKLSQLNQKLQKMWKKSPQNPMNQQSVAYNADKEEIKQVVDASANKVLDRLRV
jgi:hypothetical protein